MKDGKKLKQHTNFFYIIRLVVLEKSRAYFLILNLIYSL